jgi:hypothetical protein
MDPRHFDTLVKSLSSAGTRRGVVRRLAVLPLGVTLTALLGGLPVTAAKKNKNRNKDKQPEPNDDRGSANRREKRKDAHQRDQEQRQDQRHDTKKAGSASARSSSRNARRSARAPPPRPPIRAARRGPVPPRARTAAPSRMAVGTRSGVGRIPAAMGTPAPRTAASVRMALRSVRGSAARRGRSVRTGMDPAARRSTHVARTAATRSPTTVAR